MQGKAKLSVNVAKEWYNCWVCGLAGRNLGRLMLREDREQYYESSPHLRSRRSLVIAEDEAKPRCTSLPVGFSPFGLRASYIEGPYLSYLRSRGIEERTAELYRMGFVDEGPDCARRVVIPSFDSNGFINFWSARTIYDGVKPGYILPNCVKDIISNEHMVDWTQPVYLVEGIFDEIAIGCQAIALYGKYLPMTLIMKLMKAKPPIVYVCLDRDAMREAKTILERLVGYDIPSAIVPLPGKDPADMGGDAVREIAGNLTAVTGSASLIGARF